MAVKWRFQNYETKDGAFPIREWYREQIPEVRAAFDTAVRRLAVTEIWTEKDGAKQLTRQHSGLTELLIDINQWAPHASKGRKRRFRPIGLRDEVDRTFLLFTGCEKVGGILEPRDAFDRALKWCADWQQKIGAAHDHDV